MNSRRVSAPHMTGSRMRASRRTLPAAAAPRRNHTHRIIMSETINNPLPRLLLTEEEAARTIGFTARFLQARRLSGDGPPFVRISARAVRYRPEDIDEWAKSLIRTSTSDTGKAETS